MSLFHQHQVKTLPEWLEIATRKLTDASKERIRAEIEVHYAEAVEAHRENGLSEADAQTKGLTDLGDAKAAARRFRKQHLTERENRTLKITGKIGRTTLILSYLLFGNVALYQLAMPQNALPPPYPLLGLVLEFIVLIALPTTCFVVARLGRSKPDRYLVLLDPLSGVAPGIVLVQLFSKDLLPFNRWLSALLGLAILLHFLVHLRLWIKLGKMGPIRPQSPPPGAAQA